MTLISTDYEESSQEPLSEGVYRARVGGISVQPKKPGKEFPSIKIDLKVAVPPDQSMKADAEGSFRITDFISLSPKAGWKQEEFLEACGGVVGVDYVKTEVGPKQFKLEWDTQRFVGREPFVVINQEPEKDQMGTPKPGGRIFNRIVSYGAA